MIHAPVVTQKGRVPERQVQQLGGLGTVLEAAESRKQCVRVVVANVFAELFMLRIDVGEASLPGTR